MNNRVPFSRTNTSRGQEDDVNASRRNPLGPPRTLGPIYNSDILEWQTQALRNTRIAPMDNILYACPPVERASSAAPNYSGTFISLDTRPPNRYDLISSPRDILSGTRRMAPTNHTETAFCFDDSQCGVSVQPGTSLQFNQTSGARTAFQQYNSSTENNGRRPLVNQQAPDGCTPIRRRPRKVHPQTPVGAAIPGKYEREHPCRYAECSEVFAREYLRNRHECCHDSARPYECSVCGKSFKRKDARLRHERAATCREQSQEAQELANRIFSYRNPQC